MNWTSVPLLFPSIPNCLAGTRETISHHRASGVEYGLGVYHRGRGQTERFLEHIPRHRASWQSGNVPSVPLLVLACPPCLSIRGVDWSEDWKTSRLSPGFPQVSRKLVEALF